MYIISPSTDEKGKYVAIIVDKNGTFVRYVQDARAFDTESEAIQAAEGETSEGPYQHSAQ